MEILPNFFRHSRFQSLVRQLNFYAFKKVSKERSSWVYSHIHFQQHRPELLDKLRRKTSGIKRSSGYSLEGDECEQRKQQRLRSSTDKFSSDESSDENYEGTSIDRADSFGGSGDKYWTDRRGECFGRGEDSDEDDTDRSSTDGCVEVNYEVIHRSWDNVHQFFTDSACGRDDGSMPSPSPPRAAKMGGGGGGGDYRRRLLLFCSERNPWEHSQGLFADIHSLLSEDDRIVKELNAYVSALWPSALSCGGLSAGLGVAPHGTASCILWASEVTLVRAFMAFALACMHEAEWQQQAEALDSSLASRIECVNQWATYARVCS